MRRLVLSAFACLVAQTISAQSPAPSPSWDSLKFLEGKWIGEGSAETGQPGSGKLRRDATAR